MKIAALNKEKETPEFRARTTRLHKWRELVNQAQSDLELKPSVPDSIQFLFL